MRHIVLRIRIVFPDVDSRCRVDDGTMSENDSHAPRRVVHLARAILEEVARQLGEASTDATNKVSSHSFVQAETTCFVRCAYSVPCAPGLTMIDVFSPTDVKRVSLALSTA